MRSFMMELCGRLPEKGTNRIHIAVAATLIAIVPVPSEAQFVTQLQDGLRVRIVRNNGKATVGFISARTNDSLTIIGAKGRAPVQTFSLSDVSHVDISRGKSRAKGAALKGLMGLGVGALAGGLLGAVTYTDAECEPGPDNWCLFDCLVVCSRGQAAIFAGALGSGAGLLIGTAIGIATGWERWEAVPARIR